MQQIDYNILNNSIFYYKYIGYKYIETSWLVDPNISDLTKPVDRNNFIVCNKALVGSAEQSFMELIFNNKLEYGKYVTITPCFRDEKQIDDTHKMYFMKTELIVYDNVDKLKLMYQDVINNCKVYFDKYTITSIIKPAKEGDSLDYDEDYCHDIICSKTGIELGSYGIRTHKNYSWIYGTGCAEPRLSYAVHLGNNFKVGYHNSIIAKEKVGTFFKIIEEVEEAKDAILSGNTVMELVELSDLYGAIELYLKEKYPDVTMNHLKIMSNVTQRAFENGRR